MDTYSEGEAESHGPTASPASMFDIMSGYERTVAGEGVPAYPVPQTEQEPEQPHLNISSITEDTAREAFIQFASRKCCYSSAPAKDGVITNMETFSTYRYCLETFTESRSAKWCYEPYYDQPVDACPQPPPGPWDIAVKTPNFFVDSKQILRVPYTSYVKNCHVCSGMGQILCGNCAGAGTTACCMCNGSGLWEYDQCYRCFGRGWDNCICCNGEGSVRCLTCHERGKLLFYMSLTVKWTNNSDDHVVEGSSGLQVNKLRKVSGTELFSDSQSMVNPVMAFPDSAVVDAAQRLVSKHQIKYSQKSHILQQRQTIELIPITKVTYSWKEKSHIYFVYGNELKVNADKYPATCCCTVM